MEKKYTSNDQLSSAHGNANVMLNYKDSNDHL